MKRRRTNETARVYEFTIHPVSYTHLVRRMAKSILQGEKRCFLSGRTDALEKHHIFGGANRDVYKRQVQAFAGLGMLFSATFVVLFLTWTTCETDYYTSSLAISAATGCKRVYGVVIMPTISCILAMTHFSQYLSTFLIVMVALIVPLMGVVTADFLVVNKRKYPDISTVKEGLVPQWQPGSFIGLILGAVTVILTEQVWNIGCPAIQGIVVAFFATIIFDKVFYRPLPEKEAKL